MTYPWVEKRMALEKDIPWYGKPKQWWEETAEEKIGEGISKVPILPEFLGKVAPAFEWLHEKVEKPLASIITAPFSPSIPWRQGESWMEHEKREYDTWEAPTYVKGLAESPIYFLPVFGWAAKGVKALGAGAKLVRAIETIPSMPFKAVTIPAKKILQNTLIKTDIFRKFSLWAMDKPVINKTIEALGGRSAFARDIGDVYPAMSLETRKMVPVQVIKTAEGFQQKILPYTDVVKNELLSRNALIGMTDSYRALFNKEMQGLAGGNVKRALRVDEKGFVGAATPKKYMPEWLGTGISEVFEKPWLYDFTDDVARKIAFAGNNALKNIQRVAREAGLEIPKDIKFHRIVLGKQTPEGLWDMAEFGSKIEAKRHYETMKLAHEAAAKKGEVLLYETDPIESINKTVGYYMRKIADKRFDDTIKQYGLTVPERVMLTNPFLMDNIQKTAMRVGSASYAQQALKRVVSFEGKRIPPATLAKIEKGLPEIAAALEQALAVSPRNIEGLLKGMSTDFWKAMKLNPKEFKVLIANSPETTLLRKIESVVTQANVDRNISRKSLEKIYLNAYRMNKTRFDDAIKTVRGQVDEIIKSSKGELRGLKRDYQIASREFSESLQVLGNFEKRFRYTTRPSLNKRIFPEEIVNTIEPIMEKQTNNFLRGSAQISGVGRMVIAALDFSAPFIQGLPVLGRNPAIWTKATLKHYGFFAKPTSFYQWMANPANDVLLKEMAYYGASMSSFEFFNALKPVQELVGKIPKAGTLAQKAIGQTYGRAEVAFTGFGMLARTEMWKALRHKALKPSGVLDDVISRDLVRSIDRMTGVMSMEALGIGRTQQDFENAFMFFAPRYTRAGLSLAGDLFKGGIAGSEARKALGGLASAGTAMYMGISKALGQQPNLDPTSSRFLTVKIGDDYIGVGGITYALARLAAGVTAAAIEDPSQISPLNLSRIDNPFYKFMYNRTSPLTSAIFSGLIEQKTFFGEPLDDATAWGKFMMEKVTPIAAQSAIEKAMEGEVINPIAFLSELGGARTFPKSSYELQQDARDNVAVREFGMPYDQLDLVNRKIVDKNPEVTAFQEEIDTQTTRRGRALSVAYLERKRELEESRESHKQQIEMAAKAFEDGMITGYDFRELVSDADTGYGKTYEHINNQPRYAEIMKKYEEPGDVDRQYQWELAYDELMSWVNSDQSKDQYGMFKFDEYNELQDKLTQKYGVTNMKRVGEMRNLKYAEYPELFQELELAKEVLKPYWAVQDEVERIFGKLFAESSGGQSLISKLRKQKRLSNPQIEAAYSRFYAR